MDEQGWEQMPVCSAGLFGFGGQRGYYHDPETELYLLGGGTGSAPGSKGSGRFYDPELGRFLTQDSMGLASGSINLYRYVSNNPVDNVDPSGNTPWTKRYNRSTEEVQRIVGEDDDGKYGTDTIAAVKPLQQALIAAGFMNPTTVSGRPADDGKWGDQTEEAYRAYLQAKVEELVGSSNSSDSSNQVVSDLLNNIEELRKENPEIDKALTDIESKVGHAEKIVREGRHYVPVSMKNQGFDDLPDELKLTIYLGFLMLALKAEGDALSDNIAAKKKEFNRLNKQADRDKEVILDRREHGQYTDYQTFYHLQNA